MVRRRQRRVAKGSTAVSRRRRSISMWPEGARGSSPLRGRGVSHRSSRAPKAWRQDRHISKHRGRGRADHRAGPAHGKAHGGYGCRGHRQPDSFRRLRFPIALHPAIRRGRRRASSSARHRRSVDGLVERVDVVGRRGNSAPRRCRGSPIWPTTMGTSGRLRAWPASSARQSVVVQTGTRVHRDRKHSTYVRLRSRMQHHAGQYRARPVEQRPRSR